MPNQTKDRLARLITDHFPGSGCLCGAYGESECGCGVDWRSRKEVALSTALEYCLKKLNGHHRSRPGMPELIRNTETLRDAGNYRRDAP